MNFGVIPKIKQSLILIAADGKERIVVDRF